MLQELLIEIFLCNPTTDLYSQIDDKKQAMRRLKDLPDSASKLLFLYQMGKNIDVEKLHHLIFKEGQEDLLNEFDYDPLLTAKLSASKGNIASLRKQSRKEITILNLTAL